jgi:hypothetical protein
VHAGASHTAGASQTGGDSHVGGDSQTGADSQAEPVSQGGVSSHAGGETQDASQGGGQLAPVHPPSSAVAQGLRQTLSVWLKLQQVCEYEVPAQAAHTGVWHTAAHV